MDGINPFVIFVHGAINLAVSLRSCGLKYGDLDAIKPFNLTKAGQASLWEFATWQNFAQKKH